MTENKSSRVITLDRWIQANRKLSFLIGMLIVYILQSFFPSNFGRIYYKDSKIAAKNAWVIIKYVGDEYTYLIGNGLRNVCLSVKVVRPNSNGGFLVPSLPFYHSIRYYQDAIYIYGYQPNFSDTGSTYPHDISEYSNDIYLTRYKNKYGDENRLKALLEIAQYNLCGKAFWNETSRKLYKALYDEAKVLVTTSSNPYRFQIPRKICNIAIGDPINEPRADECPWLTDEY